MCKDCNDKGYFWYKHNDNYQWVRCLKCGNWDEEKTIVKDDFTFTDLEGNKITQNEDGNWIINNKKDYNNG